jgi:hypothetical protein
MWKYALIKIEFPGLWENEDHCELVELYKDNVGEYSAFSKASIKSLKQLEAAYMDVLNDGINNWFSENGVFEWNSTDKFWNWSKNK